MLEELASLAQAMDPSVTQPPAHRITNAPQEPASTRNVLHVITLMLDKECSVMEQHAQLIMIVSLDHVLMENVHCVALKLDQSVTTSNVRQIATVLVALASTDYVNSATPSSDHTVITQPVLLIPTALLEHATTTCVHLATPKALPSYVMEHNVLLMLNALLELV